MANDDQEFDISLWSAASVTRRSNINPKPLIRGMSNPGACSSLAVSY